MKKEVHFWQVTMTVSILCKYTKAGLIFCLPRQENRQQSMTLIARVHIFSSKCYLLKVEIIFLSFILLTMDDAFSNSEAKFVRRVDNFFIGCLENCNFWQVTFCSISIIPVKTKPQHHSKDVWCICKRKRDSIAKLCLS